MTQYCIGQKKAAGSGEGHREPPHHGLSFTPLLRGDRDSDHQPLVKCDKVAVLTHSKNIDEVFEPYTATPETHGPCLESKLS